MRRETQHMLLLILGGALIQIAANDVYLRYIRPGHRWLLVGAGAAAVVLASVALVRDSRAGARGDCSHGHGHGYGPAERHMPWLLLVPVLVIALATPPALGADSVDRSGAGNTLDAEYLLPPLPSSGTPELTVAEFVQRAVWDSGRSLDGREVTLTGFAVRRGAAVDLARLTIMCCAADARANRVHLVGDIGDVPADTWLRVNGTLQPGTATAASRYVPAVTVRAVEIIPAPSDPYEF
jgi:uncharacterized repeat protein (TIGR03943 family)